MWIFTGLTTRFVYDSAINDSNAKQFLMHLSVWNPQWSMLLRLAPGAMLQHNFIVQLRLDNQHKLQTLEYAVSMSAWQFIILLRSLHISTNYHSENRCLTFLNIFSILGDDNQDSYVFFFTISAFLAGFCFSFISFILLYMGYCYCLVCWTVRQ